MVNMLMQRGSTRNGPSSNDAIRVEFGKVFARAGRGGECLGQRGLRCLILLQRRPPGSSNSPVQSAAESVCSSFWLFYCADLARFTLDRQVGPHHVTTV